MIARILSLVLLLCPSLAWASGAYLPPWAEVAFWLILTPGGWAVIFIFTVAVIAGIIALVRRK